MPKRSIRLTDAIDQRIQSAAKLRGYSTPSAFLRAAIKKELDELGDGSAPNEKVLGYTRDCVRTCAALKELNRLYLLFNP